MEIHKENQSPETFLSSAIPSGGESSAKKLGRPRNVNCDPDTRNSSLVQKRKELTRRCRREYTSASQVLILDQSSGTGRGFLALAIKSEILERSTKPVNHSKPRRDLSRQPQFLCTDDEIPSTAYLWADEYLKIV